jgi:hypothetical protein
MLGESVPLQGFIEYGAHRHRIAGNPKGKTITYSAYLVDVSDEVALRFDSDHWFTASPVPPQLLLRSSNFKIFPAPESGSSSSAGWETLSVT